MKKTKIVVTLGPVTSSKEAIKSLIERGVNVFRLNFSHGSYETHQQLIDNIRMAEKELNENVAILQDISGPKIRIGEVDGVLKLKAGDRVKLVKQNSDRYSFTLTYPEIIDMVNIDEEVYFADGTIRSRIIEKNQQEAVLEILTDGVLTSHKGVNFPHTKLDIEVITKKDKEDLKFGATAGVDLVALSFVHSKDDILKAREILKKEGVEKFIISKIETKFAIDNLDEIIEYSDGVMVARGDLGVELGVEKIPNIQKHIIKEANQKSKPVITATQMLTSMIKSPYPTRAEISDIANAVLDGSDAVMLSDETTIGDFPFKAVDVLRESVIEAEKEYPFFKDLTYSKKSVLSKSAVDVAKALFPNGIVTFTTTGFTAKNISKFRPKTKIYAIVWDEKIYKELNIVWGVESVFIEKKDSLLDMMFEFIEKMNKKEFLYVITMGFVGSGKHNTNILRIIDEESIKYIKENKWQ
jgi:pyruvate kinase